MICAQRTLYTIGHSTRTPEELMGDVARWKERFTDVVFAEVAVTGAECVVAVASIEELTKRRWPLRAA